MKDRLYEGFNVLIVGAGKVADRHVEAQRDLGAQVTLYDVISQKAKNKAKVLGVGSTNDLEGAISSSDLVYICTPANLHSVVAKKAIQAGKDIFCEKPLTSDLARAEELASLVDKFGTKFIVANYVRLEPNFLEAKRIVQSGELGRMLAINGFYFQNIDYVGKETPWRREVPVLFDGGVHPIDTVCWMADEPVVGVCVGTGSTPEDVRLFLSFESGLNSTIRVFANADPAIVGVGLSLVGALGTANTHHKWDHLDIDINGENIRRQTPTQERPVNAAARIVNAYLTGLRPDHAPLPDIHQAIPIIRILDMAQKDITRKS